MRERERGRSSMWAGGRMYGAVSFHSMVALCLFFFLSGWLFSDWMWPISKSQDLVSTRQQHQEDLQLVAEDCTTKNNDLSLHRGDILGKVLKTHDAMKALDKVVSNLEMELGRAAQPVSPGLVTHVAAEVTGERKKAFIMIGINTAFSSRERRDSVRGTWMLQGENLRRLEHEKGIVIRFVIGRSSIPGGILDRAIDAENAQHNDFLRLDHTEGYLELSAKTMIFFSTAVTKWDADFYVKVDDDIHVNIGALATNLARHRSKPRVYIGCMKSGPVLSSKLVKYYEPEFWKFGEEGNKYFRHATGQLYAISKDLATYISINQPILHRYVNEDVSLGAWLFGLDVEHVHDRSLCCGTPPDCELKAQAGSFCVASFDWYCSGICKSVERMKVVHTRCGEGQDAVWSATF